MRASTSVGSLWAIVAISSSLAVAAPADAVVAIDNTNNGTSAFFGGYAVRSTQYLGASFTTGPNSGGYNITEFLLAFSAGQAGINFSASLYGGAIPSGAPLALDSIAFPFDPNGANYYSFNSSLIPNIASMVLSPSSSYVLSLSTTSGIDSGWAYSSGTGGTSYVTSGGFSVSPDLLFTQGGSWKAISDANDLLYRLSVNPVDSTPVPAPLPIFGAATFMGFSRKLRKRITNSKVSIGNTVN